MAENAVQHMNGDGMALPKRSVVPSLFALAKKHFSSVISNAAEKETFKVRLNNEQKYEVYLGRIANKLDSLNVAIKNFPKIELAESPASIQIQTMSEATISRLINQLDDIRKAVLATKPFPNPKVQQIQGAVSLTNQKEFPIREITQRLDELKTVLSNLRLEVPEAKEIKIPEFPKQIGLVEAKAILKALQDVSKKLDSLPKKFPDVEFPREVAVSNFPPQHIPTPVTHVSLNGLRGYIKSRNITVTTTATPLPDEVLANRRSLVIYNNSSANIFIGGSDVTSTNGMIVPASSYSPALDASSNLIVYGIVSSGTANVRVLEASDEVGSGQ